MKELSECWDYPEEAPTSNVFESHPGYDEASGPRNPNGDRFVPIDEVPEEIYFDSELAGLDESDESVTAEPILRPFQVYAQTAQDLLAVLMMPPIVEIKLSLKEFDRGPRGCRWKKSLVRLPIIA